MVKVGVTHEPEHWAEVSGYDEYDYLRGIFRSTTKQAAIDMEIELIDKLKYDLENEAPGGGR